MSSRVLWIVAGAGLLAGVGSLAAYPAWLRHRAEGQAESDACQGDKPPRAGFFAAIRDDDRVAAFPGFGHSDAVAAEAAFCVGTFAQACLAAEDAAPPDRRRTCERWREFARWYRGTGRNPPEVCRACPELEE